jgi:predicted NUDIX family NTP pyrophosphohydrolase
VVDPQGRARARGGRARRRGTGVHRGTGHRPPAGASRELGTVSQRGGRKQITVYAREGDFAPEHLHPGTFDLEWPPRSGTMQTFPEIDRVAWFDLDTARHKLVAAQVEFVDRLVAELRTDRVTAG